VIELGGSKECAESRIVVLKIEIELLDDGLTLEMENHGFISLECQESRLNPFNRQDNIVERLCSSRKTGTVEASTVRPAGRQDRK
jgi:hypothetical protein